MADRKNERQGRRAAANRPKVAASKAAGGVKKAKPASSAAAAKRRPATQGKTVAARGNSPPPLDRQPDEAALVDPVLPRSVSVDVGIPVEWGAETSPIPMLRPDWTIGADEALKSAIEAYAVYQRLHAFFGPLEAGQQRDRDNRLDDMRQALAELHEDEATAEATIRVLREQIELPATSATSIQQAGYVFRTLTHGAKSFFVTVGRWVAEGLVKGEVAHLAPGLIDQLRNLLHEAATVIASLFQ